MKSKYPKKFSPEYLALYKRDKTCFGGALLRGNPKRKRPFHSRAALHLVLRAKNVTKRQNLLQEKNFYEIKKIIRRQAFQFQIRIYRQAVHFNHIHLLVRPQPKRILLANFLRAIAGLIARKILNAERSRPGKIKLWESRPFSRIVNWGRPFQRCLQYIEKNLLTVLDLDIARLYQNHAKQILDTS